MVKVKQTDEAAKPIATTPPRNPIRALYGVFINDEMRQVRSEISATVQVLEDAIEDGDRDIQGAKDRRVTDTAIKALKEAIAELRPGTRTRTATAAASKPAAPSAPVIRPLYGVFIESQVSKAITQVQGHIDEIKDAQKAKKIPAAEVDDVKRALKDLQSALKKLEKVKAS